MEGVYLCWIAKVHSRTAASCVQVSDPVPDCSLTSRNTGGMFYKLDLHGRPRKRLIPLQKVQKCVQLETKVKIEEGQLRESSDLAWRGGERDIAPQETFQSRANEPNGLVDRSHVPSDSSVVDRRLGMDWGEFGRDVLSSTAKAQPTSGVIVFCMQGVRRSGSQWDSPT